MKRIAAVLRKRATYANVVATVALFVAMGGTAAAAVIISSNSQVGVNTISGHQPPSGKHANLISGSVNGTDLATGLNAALHVHCRSGMQRGGDLCFDVSPRPAAVWQTALSTCANAGLRLASAGELSEIFDHTGAPQLSQWTDSVYLNSGTFEGTLLSENSARQIGIGAGLATGTAQYRCVANPTN